MTIASTLASAWSRLFTSRLPEMSEQRLKRWQRQRLLLPLCETDKDRLFRQCDTFGGAPSEVSHDYISHGGKNAFLWHVTLVEDGLLSVPGTIRMPLPRHITESLMPGDEMLFLVDEGSDGEKPLIFPIASSTCTDPRQTDLGYPAGGLITVDDRQFINAEYDLSTADSDATAFRVPLERLCTADFCTRRPCGARVRGVSAAVNPRWMFNEVKPSVHPLYGDMTRASSSDRCVPVQMAVHLDKKWQDHDSVAEAQSYPGFFG